MSYQVTARRWARGWELDIDGETVTQSHGLHDAEAMIRDWLDITEHADARTAELLWSYDLGDDAIGEELERARMATRAAEEQQRVAAARFREVITGMSRAGLRGSDIAKVTGLSKQRISQLIR